MDLTSKTVIKDLLKRYGAKAEKGLGQHFILSKKALGQMIKVAEINKNDTIIEIGPGLGTLTQELAKSEAKIIAIEKDLMMINILRETLKDFKNIKIIQADARIHKFTDVGHLYKIVANLPYNIATFLIHQWLELKKPPEAMVLMLQKEVAQRIAAKPPRMNLLAVSVQFYADVKIIDYVKKGSFWPQPKVDSAIIEITPKKPTRLSSRSGKFFEVVKAGFSQPRKQLLGNLSKKLSDKDEKITKEKILSAFKKLDISENARAENLSLEQWISLAINLYPFRKKKITN